ncbi:hypothetical protein H2248_004201 [Termitomyces sp. 'cryptogamus']|nr:hypothetical protein H2248_004201 [Termitomyces sp. 'cryptogamus']
MSNFNLLPPPFSLPSNSVSPLPRGRRRLRLRLKLLPTITVCIFVLLYLKFMAWSTHSVEPLPNPEYVTSEKSPIAVNQHLRILLVSAFFPLTHAKHTHEEYVSWLRNFFGPDGIQSDVYFYTTVEMAELVSLYSATSSSVPPARAQNHNRLTINTTFTSPFTIPPIAPYISEYNAMHVWDRERAIHNPELYAVWNAKPWLLEHALLTLSHSQQEYDYAFWVDAGSFRASHPFRKWPDPRRVQEVLSTSQSENDMDKILIPLYDVPGLKEYKWRFEMGPVDMDLSEGTFFGSTPTGISWFSKTFYQTHDWYITTSPPVPPPHSLPPGIFLNLMKGNITAEEPRFHFVGKDQTLINTIMFRYPERFVGLLGPGNVGLLPPSSSTTSPSSTSTPSNPPFEGPNSQPKSKMIPYILTLPSILTRISHSLSHSLSLPFSLSFSRSFSLSFDRTKSCGDWYFYQWFLASEREREEAKATVWWWAGCPRVIVSMTRSTAGSDKKAREVVDVEEMLQGLFGGRWVEGRRAGGA